MLLCSSNKDSRGFTCKVTGALGEPSVPSPCCIGVSATSPDACFCTMVYVVFLLEQHGKQVISAAWQPCSQQGVKASAAPTPLSRSVCAGGRLWVQQDHGWAPDPPHKELWHRHPCCTRATDAWQAHKGEAPAKDQTLSLSGCMDMSTGCLPSYPQGTLLELTSRCLLPASTLLGIAEF